MNRFTVLIRIVDDSDTETAYTEEPARYLSDQMGQGWVEVYAHPVVDPVVRGWWSMHWEDRDASGYGPPMGAR